MNAPRAGHSTSPDDTHHRLDALRQRLEGVLEQRLSLSDAPTARLLEAMRYSVLGGGKRLRGLLVYVSGECCGAPMSALDAAAAAVELIHAYSLVHDDLPAMDNDDLRRGRPTCHRAFDEGTAMLAGDALQALAFEALADAANGASDAARANMLHTLARAIGTLGMAGGQAMDLGAAGQSLDFAQLELMHRRKTGALIQASVELGCSAAGSRGAPWRAALARYGAEIGLAFQIQDDILDVTGDTATLGKRSGADAALNKPTYPSLLGLARARALADAHCSAALAAIALIALDTRSLRDMAELMVKRAH